MYGYYGDVGYHSIFGGALMFIFWLIVIAIIISLIRHGSHMHMHGWDKGGHHAIDILKERYAKGELTKEEFESKKKDLM